MTRHHGRLFASVLVGAALLLGCTACGPLATQPASATTPVPATSNSSAITMPTLVGTNAKAAQDKLVGLGLSSHNITFGSADPKASVVILPQNWTVTDQSLPAGTPVDSGTHVVLTVVKTADAGTPVVVAMPDLVGLNGQVAKDKLTGLGLSQFHISFGSADPNASVVLLPQNWRVVGQSVPAGAQVDIGSTIVLTVVKLTT